MAQYFDRYNNFRVNGDMKPLPFISIPVSQDDKYFIYKKGESRLDKISNLYYNNPYSGWLIMLANPEFGGLEFNIPDRTLLRVPFPFQSGLDRYITGIKTHTILYGE